eukprot:scaffold1852_cov244-Pinguiococcus_pyrenoidosus.AAC.1
MHHTVEGKLPRRADHVLARLLDLRAAQRIGLVDAPESLHHLRQLAGSERLYRKLHDGGIVEHQRLEDRRRAPFPAHVRYGRRLVDRRVDALQHNPVARANPIDFDVVAPLRNGHAFDGAKRHVLLVFAAVSLPKHFHLPTQSPTIWLRV